MFAVLSITNYLADYSDCIKNVNCVQDMMLTLFMSAAEKKEG